MNTYSSSSRIAGTLFIIATVTGIVSVMISKPILDAPDFLSAISSHHCQLILAAFLELIMATACAGIAISMYPVLKDFNSGLALGSVGFRLIEGILGIIGVLCLLQLVSLSEEFVKPGVSASCQFHTLGTLFLSGRAWIGGVVMPLAWNIGALMYYSIMYNAKLVPRWLSLWGFVGSVLTIGGVMLVLFRFIAPFSAMHVILNLPHALQEIVLALWLILKQFDPVERKSSNHSASNQEFS
jgi:hypothetical protein